MKVTPVRSPLDGEQIVAVDPPLLPRVDAGWRRRLHLFTGRSLDATALAAGQSARAARTALLARTLSPGIVAGLEAGLEGTGVDDAFLDLAPGLGITAWGEDVRLARGLRVRLDQIQTIDTAGGGAGRILRERIDDGDAVPGAVILVLQPVTVEEIGATDPLDPCERDPQSEAFEDQRTVDACRPLLVLWPEEWLPLPDDGPQWRNRLAWAIFEKARVTPGPLPWEEIGLPLGLVATGSFTGGLFLDRSVVARIGGRPRPRSPLLPEAGDPSLWQARIQQCAEQLAELFADPKTTAADAAAHFERLPPAGLLPVEAATFARPAKGADDQDGGDQSFFPRNFHVGAAPIPLDELEPVFDASAPLAPLVLREDEEVQLLVPVPGTVYEPDLLVQERVDPEFETTLAEFRTDRDKWLGRRQDVRDKAETLTRALGGTVAKLPFPDADPDQQAGEEATLPPDPAEEMFGTEGELDARTVPVRQSLEKQFVEAAGRFKIIESEWNAALLTAEGLDGLIRVLAHKVAKANDKIDLGFLSLQTEIYRIRQIALGNVAGTRLATSPVLAEIAQGESAKVTRENIEKVFRSRGAESFALAAGAEATALTGTSSLFARTEAPTVAGLGGTTLKRETVGVLPIGTVARVGEFQIEATAVPKVVPEDVRQESPITGAVLDRSLSVAQRLSIPPAHQAQDFALANLLQILEGLDDLGLVVDDLRVPLFTLTNGVRQRNDQPYVQIRANLRTRILEQPKVQDADEANILGDAVSFQENASVFLRRLEGRVQLYQAALDTCRQVAEEIRGLLTAARQRLANIDRELAEARHDVTVALALLEEETKRIEGINSHRLEVLTHHVPFLAWHRPRMTETLAETPVRPLDPGLFEDPVPAALARPADPPAELREMVELLREAPLRWFRRLPPLLDKLDRLDVLQTTLRLAKGRAETAIARPPAPLATLTLTSPAAQGASQTLVARRQTVVQHKTEMARVDLSAVERQSWKGAADLAKKVLSLGDLLDIPHGRAEVARLGARELDEILRVATALWAEFGEVLPALRLDWVERLSQFDTPFDLRALSNLPRWEQIEVLDRRTLQALVDWLFQRIDLGEPEAVVMINDLVRVALLLASHAPVDRIVAGHVAEETPIRPGGTVPLVVDLSRVRIGMQVLLFSQEKTVARGVVEDLGDGRATARVLQSFAGQVSVAKNARVEFTDALQGKTLK